MMKLAALYLSGETVPFALIFCEEALETDHGLLIQKDGQQFEVPCDYSYTYVMETHEDEVTVVGTIQEAMKQINAVSEEEQ